MSKSSGANDEQVESWEPHHELESNRCMVRSSSACSCSSDEGGVYWGVNGPERGEEQMEEGGEVICAGGRSSFVIVFVSPPPSYTYSGG